MRAKEIVKKYFPKESNEISEDNVLAVCGLIHDEINKEIKMKRPKTNEALCSIFTKWNQKWLDIVHTEESGSLAKETLKNYLRGIISFETWDILYETLGWYHDELA